MKRIYINSNNILVIAENLDITNDKRNPSSNIYAEINGKIYAFYKISVDEHIETINFDDILDENGIAYSSQTVFTDLIESANNTTSASSNTDYFTEIAKGNIVGTSQVNKFGANVSIASDTEEDVWDVGGTYPFPIISDITHLSQVSNDITMLGATIEIQGLDSNWDLTVQTAVLDGTDTSILVALTTPLIRVFRLKVLANIVSSENIQVTNSIGNIIYAQIVNGNNQTLMAIYTVPNGKTAYMTQYYANNINSTGKTAKATEIKVWVADRLNGYEFQIKHANGIPKEGTMPDHSFKPYMKITEKSDIKISAEPLDEDGHVHAGFDLILIDN